MTANPTPKARTANVYAVAIEGAAYFQLLRRCDGTTAYPNGAPCDKSLVAPDPRAPVALCRKCAAFRVAANQAAFRADLANRGA